MLKSTMAYKAYEADKAKALCKTSVLIIEDDPFSQKLFNSILTSNVANAEPHIVGTYDEALSFIKYNPPPHLIIMDVFLGEGPTGIDLYKYVKSINPNIPIIITSVLDEKRLMDLLGHEQSPPPFLRKPFQFDLCGILIESMINKGTKS